MDKSDKSSLVTAGEHFHWQNFESPPLFRPMRKKVSLHLNPPKGSYPAKGLARISQTGTIVFNPKRKALPVERIVRAHVTLRENGEKPRPENRTAPGHTAQGVCLEGSVDDLLEQCRRVDARLRAGAPIPSSAATMLFYGPPGTGKTALARHIAETLDRGCLIRRPSDLLSMWVGESEKNIAGAFQDASDARGFPRGARAVLACGAAERFPRRIDGLPAARATDETGTGGQADGFLERIHCPVYRMDSQRGSFDLLR
jgi:hypothetical protein